MAVTTPVPTWSIFLLTLTATAALAQESNGTSGTSTTPANPEESLLYPSQTTLRAWCAAGVETGKKEVADHIYYDLKLTDDVVLITPGGNAFNICAAATYKVFPVPKAFRADALFVAVHHAFQDVGTVRNQTATLLFQDEGGKTLLRLTPSRKLYTLKDFVRPCGNESCKADGYMRLYFTLPPLQRTAGTARIELDVDHQDGSPIEQFQLYPRPAKSGAP